MITAIIYGLLCVLLLRWVIWITLRLLEQEEEPEQWCRNGLKDSQDESKFLSCLLHSGLSE